MVSQFGCGFQNATKDQIIKFCGIKVCESDEYIISKRRKPRRASIIKKIIVYITMDRFSTCKILFEGII